MDYLFIIDPIAFKLGPLSVRWYGIIIGAAIALGLYLVIREGNKRGLPKDTFPDLLIWAIPISIISARIYYVAFEWPYYSANPADIIKIWNGGIAIHGGLLGAILTGIVFSYKKKISFWKLADIAAPSILLGQAIGRWGNFINQEAHGEPVSRGFLESIQIPKFIINQMYIDGQYFHPTFLYESIWNIIGVAVLIMLRNSAIKRGELFLSYLIWYSVGRFFIEGMRTDSLMLTSSLRIAQLMSIILIAVSLIIIVVKRLLRKNNPYYFEEMDSIR